MSRPDAPQTGEPQIPPAAEAIIELLNSRSHATPPLPDTLDTDRTAAEILRPFGQPAGTAPPAVRLDQVRALRDRLMAAVDASDPSDAAKMWAEVSSQVATVTFRQVFAPSGAPQLSQATGDPIIGAITRAVAELLTSGTWRRIRACANDQCDHVFYDRTRGRTGRWHSYEMCGNRSNVAAFRARRAAHAAKAEET